MGQWNVSIYSQRTMSLCWEACGRMMWDWRYRNNANMLGGYAMAAGPFRVVNQGLTNPQMDAYYRRLGLRAWAHPQGQNIRHALQWSPVVATDQDQVLGHAVIIAGYFNGQYTVINPCAVENVDFENTKGSCAAGALLQSEAEVNGKLGPLIWYW